MVEWWEGLTQLQQVFVYIAAPSTLILILQIILALIGIGGGGGDFDAGGDADGDVSVDDGDFDGEDVEIGADPGLQLFTLRGAISFFTIFGWTGLAVSRGGGSNWLSVILAFIAGLVVFFAVAAIFRFLMTLQSDGTLDYRNALGLSATVYLTIPPARSDKGKVNALLQGRYAEIDAVTDEETPIKFGEEVVVIGLSGNNTLVVKRK